MATEENQATHEEERSSVVVLPLSATATVGSAVSQARALLFELQPAALKSFKGTCVFFYLVGVDWGVDALKEQTCFICVEGGGMRAAPPPPPPHWRVAARGSGRSCRGWDAHPVPRDSCPASALSSSRSRVGLRGAAPRGAGCRWWGDCSPRRTPSSTQSPRASTAPVSSAHLHERVRARAGFPHRLPYILNANDVVCKTHNTRSEIYGIKLYFSRSLECYKYIYSNQWNSFCTFSRLGVLYFTWRSIWHASLTFFLST